MKKITFNIAGLHCSSCKTLVEAEVGEMPGVKKIVVLYDKGHAGVEYDETKINLDQIFNKIKTLGYKPELLNITATGKKGLNKNWIAAGIFVLVFAAGYLLIEVMGGFSIMASLNDKNVGLGLIFIIGILASFHCVGMCGGFIMAYSTINKNEKVKIKNYHLHLQYNAGRFISYTIIGGILGGFGSFFGINPNFSGTLLLIAAIFMVMMGLGLATEISWLEKIKLKTPEFIAKFIFKNRQNRQPKGPFVIGLLTGFMPCGPLQAMQLYALSTGSALNGALTMAVYALGTIPLLFGFGSIVSLLTTSRMQKLLRISGIIVILLGLLTFSRALSSFGLLSPAAPQTVPVAAVEPQAQLAELTVGYSGYQPNIIYIKAGVPVHWIIHHPRATGCTDAIILYNGDQQIEKNLVSGDTIIDFTPVAGASEIKFSCGMRMVWGKFIIQ
jgi:sulfite exporter TauE/SafE/copper chaperone CopZ